jgi:hypothetical protein
MEGDNEDATAVQLEAALGIYKFIYTLYKKSVRVLVCGDVPVSCNCLASAGTGESVLPLRPHAPLAHHVE